MRQLEEDILENNNRNEYEIADELPPPTYNSLFSDDLLLPPPTTRDERRESVLIEGIQYENEVHILGSLC